MNDAGNTLGNGFWKDMPWWVKAVAIVGVPSILSLGIVWSDRVQLLGVVETNGTILRTMQAEARTHVDRDASIDMSILEATRETNRLLLAACVNDASKISSPESAENARNRCTGTR